MYNFTGQTALVTGASSGLGVEFARHLAGRGADLILVARRQDRLAVLAEEIKSSFGVKVTVIARDLSLSRAGAALLGDISRRNIQVDVVINNAGFGTFGPVAAEDPTRAAEEIALNVGAVVDLSNAVLPSMLERNSGVIINVASSAAFQPVPYLATYSATKAFVLSFTEAIWGETRHTGVRVLALCPGPTATEFLNVAGASSTSGQMARAEEVVATAFRALGRRKPSVIHGRKNRVRAFATRFASRKTILILARRMMAKSQPAFGV